LFQICYRFLTNVMFLKKAINWRKQLNFQIRYDKGKLISVVLVNNKRMSEYAYIYIDVINQME